MARRRGKSWSCVGQLGGAVAPNSAHFTPAKRCNHQVPAGRGPGGRPDGRRGLRGTGDEGLIALQGLDTRPRILANRPEQSLLLAHITRGELAMAFEHGENLDAFRTDSVDDPVPSLDDLAHAGSGKLGHRSAHLRELC